MSTTLLEVEAELSKQLGDYWASTTTSDGASGGTTLIDTALKAKENVWITDESYDMLTEGTASAAVGTITSNTLANPTVVTTSAVHGLTTGDIVTIAGSNSTPVIDGIRTVTVLTTATFTVPVNVTVAGTAGTITAGTLYEERKISSLSNTAGTLTVLAHGGGIGSGIDYRIHRLFSASDKRRALVSAAKNIYPACFAEIWDESLVSGNWLKDGSFERWTSGALTDWTETDVTTTDTTDSPYYKHGTHSCKLSGAIGNIACSITNFDDLKHLAGKTVTFTVQGWSDTASCLRLSIYDGTTTTLSSYHDELSAWTAHKSPLKVQATIDANPTEITFKIYHAIATTATSYVDDARVISDYRGRTYIGHLGLAKNKPHQVFIEPNDYSQEEDWLRVRDYKIDKDGYLYIPTNYSSDYRLRIKGIGYLDFLASGVSSTAWTAAIELDAPQLEILVAQAALYLYTWMAMPNYESGTREDYIQTMVYWRQELAERKARFGMASPGATIHWGVH